MVARARTWQRTAVLLSVVAGTGVAAWSWMSVRDPDVRPQEAAADIAGAVVVAGADSTSGGRADDTRDRQPIGTVVDEAATVAARLLTIEVRDSAAQLVEMCRVTLRNESDAAFYQAGDGAIRVPFDQAPGTWRVSAGLPGRWVARPLLPFSRPDVVTVGIGDVGTLRVRCQGTDDAVDIVVYELRDGRPWGWGAHAQAAGGTVDLKVAAGATEYRVTASVGEWNAVANVVGPRGQSDVVDVPSHSASSG